MWKLSTPARIKGLARGSFAALFLCAVGPGNPAWAGPFLTGSEFERLFAGITLAGLYADGVSFEETYAKDGSIDYADDRGRDHGRWSVAGNAFCTFYDTLAGGCFAVEQESANCFTFYAVDGSARREAVWTAHGWDTARRPTCSGAEVAGLFYRIQPDH